MRAVRLEHEGKTVEAARESKDSAARSVDDEEYTSVTLATDECDVKERHDQHQCLEDDTLEIEHAGDGGDTRELEHDERRTAARAAGATCHEQAARRPKARDMDLYTMAMAAGAISTLQANSSSEIGKLATSIGRISGSTGIIHMKDGRGGADHEVNAPQSTTLHCVMSYVAIYSTST